MASEEIGRRFKWEGAHAGGDVAAAWLAAQLFRKVYAADNHNAAQAAPSRPSMPLPGPGRAELDTLARTVRSWQQEILAYHSTHQSNGPTDAVNLLIEKIRRIGHGFRNFDNYRLRLLLRCGVISHHPPANRIRGRQPRLIA